MQTKDFTDSVDAVDYFDSLAPDNSVSIVKTVDDIFRVTWIPNKMFTSFDGKEYIDEVWTKEDGTMIVCQDLGLEHAKNIIRMMLRNSRLRDEAEQEILEALQGAIQEITDEFGVEDTVNDANDTRQVYH